MKVALKEGSLVTKKEWKRYSEGKKDDERPEMTPAWER